MKLIRFGAPGAETPGVQLADGTRIDASGFGRDWDEGFFAEPLNLDELVAWVAVHSDTAPRVSADMRLGPPVAKPSKIVCIGLNYSDHARETGQEPPKEPILFMKSTTALCGPDDALIIPRGSEKTDWEVELAVVIGKKASYVDEEHAASHIAGYVLHNDYSERAFQIERGGQWVKGKSCDTFAPLGPFLATPDEFPEGVDNLHMWLKVNGDTKQDSSTSNLIFNVPFLISYVSQFMTLLPGDIISTGTPPGVGLGLKPPQFIKPGDVVELGIQGLGKSQQHAVAWH